MYNHDTMNSHDARPTSRHHHRHSRSRSSGMLCVLAAAALCANHHAAVEAFGTSMATSTTKSPSTKRTSALESSTAIPQSPVVPTMPSFDFGDLLILAPPKKQTKTSHKKKAAVRPRSATSLETTTTLPLAQQPQRQPLPLASSSSLPPLLDEREVLRRKREWAERYTSVEALRETFGANENKLWGDLQASTARRLYKTLLPRALLDLSQLGVGQLQPHDLAPLAFQARLAAKLYARERCTVPARMAATLFDGFRQFCRYGTFQGHGMTYDQIWTKYSTKLLEEASSSSSTTASSSTDVCLKILERSCVSNSGVDALVKVHDPIDATTTAEQQRLLERIHAQLEQDMYQLLLPPDNDTNDCRRRPAAAVQATNDQQPPCHDDNDNDIPLHRQERRTRRPWTNRNRDHVSMVRLLAKQRRLQQRRQELSLGSEKDNHDDDATATALRP